jgi:hypothetical protein
MVIFAADLKNQPGELAHMCDALAQRGVNVELAGLTSGGHGLVLFTASDETAARAALIEASVSFAEHPSLLVKTPDQPGEAAKIGRLLSQALVNIEAYLPTSICGGEVTVAIGVDKVDEARRALGDMVVG